MALGGVSHGWVGMPGGTGAKQAFQVLGGTVSETFNESGRGF
jgi:hypothetical protein